MPLSSEKGRTYEELAVVLFVFKEKRESRVDSPLNETDKTLDGSFRLLSHGVTPLNKLGFLHNHHFTSETVVVYLLSALLLGRRPYIAHWCCPPFNTHFLPLPFLGIHFLQLK